MAGSFTTTEANVILTAKFKTLTNYGVLLTASPTDAGTLTNEVANAAAYVRPATTFGDNATARAIANTDFRSGKRWRLGYCYSSGFRNLGHMERSDLRMGSTHDFQAHRRR